MTELVSNLPDGGLIIAIDGPSGTGKSTVSRALATRLGAKYLDTGAMYRVATLHSLNKGIDPSDTAAVIAATAVLPLDISDDPSSTEVLLDGVDVQREIRGPEVTRTVSAISAIPEVRKNLVALQRQLSTAAHRCVVEGRDIGTVVLIDAPLKAYLTASAEVRAQRRKDQDEAAGRSVDFNRVLAEVVRRDELDSTRSVSPLKPADDAVILDTSDMSMDDVLSTLINLAHTSAERSSK